MAHRYFRRFIFLSLLIWGRGGIGHSEEVTYLPAREYFGTVQREMGQATSSITVCLYSFTFRPHQADSPVFALAHSLKLAHDRGVFVDVLLDQNINFIEGEEGGSDLSEGKNAPAYAFLRAQGTPVAYDDASTYLHSKVLVIDGETVILGSTNWTDSALNRNEESNLIVRSRTLAKEVLSHLAAIPRQDPLPNYDGAGVEVPGAFLQNPKLFGRMVSRKDERAFDAYLFLLKVQSEQSNEREGPVLVNHKVIAEALRINTSSRKSYRRQVNRILAKLQKLYGLIDLQPIYNKDTEVTFRDLPVERTAHVPLRYWTVGWDRRLSFAEKGFFLVGQYEMAISTRRPRWSVAQKTLARRYGASPWWFSQGSTGLRRLNLLEVDFAPLIEGQGPRYPTTYTPNPLYDPVEWEKKMEKLKAKHGIEKFERARKAAAVVYEDADVNGIKELIDLENQYGVERVAEGVRILGLKNPDNPLRTMGYLIGTIRNLTGVQ